MEYYMLYMTLLISLLFIFFFLIMQKRVQSKKLPPSPPSLPIIGYLHLMKRPIWCSLHKVSNQYGSILSLKSGCRPVLVVSTPSAIEECFTKNDIIFANRPLLASKKNLDYNFSTVGSAPYGHHWRSLRRFSALYIFSSARINMSSGIRTEEIRFLTKQLFVKGAQKVDMWSFFYMLSSNIMMKMVSGNRYFKGDVLDSSKTKRKLDDFRQLFIPTTDMALGDLFPFLKWLNFVGVQRKNMRRHRKRDKFTQALIDESRDIRSSNSAMEGEKRQSIINVMLSLQESEPEFFTDEIIKGMIQTMLIAGTETSAVTMKAAVSFLMSHPAVLKKARDEIDSNVEQSRLLEDGDLAKLKYLQWILNETLRLGPTVPLIPPRESSAECTVGGFRVPHGTMLMVNTWALHNDPGIWEGPNEFKPERFQDFEMEKGGFRFIPFGTGRRQCPGASLATRLMALALGTLMQCFDWEKAEVDCLGTETELDTAKDKAEKKIIFRPRDRLVYALSQL